MFESLQMSNIMLQEVRQGLFRIYWNLQNLEQEAGSIFIQTVQLCGSRSQKIYSIIYKLKRNTDDSAKAKKTMKYAYSLTVKENLGDGAETKGIETSSPIQSPLYVWLKSRLANKEDIRLKTTNSVKWNVNRKTNSPKECFTLYLDFGTNTKSESKIIEGFENMFYAQNFCDVHFHFNDGQTIGAHANVLSIGSPVFSAMFQSNMLESQTRQVVITDFDLEVFRQLLIHLYTGRAPKLVKEDITQQLYEAADKYDVESIKHECIDVLLKRVKLENAISLLIWADFHSIAKLHESALRFLVENCREICVKSDWLHFIKNHPELCMLITQRMSALIPVPIVNQ